MSTKKPASPMAFLANTTGQADADVSSLYEAVAAVVAWCREAEAQGAVPVNFMDRVVADNEFYRLCSEREVLQECLCQLDAAQNIGALRELLGTRIETLNQRIALFEVEDGKKSIGDTGTG